MIKNENYLTIQGFMINKLGLKGNNLLIYAIIYGFSQEENCEFTGSLSYLAAWTNSTKSGVIKNLKYLVEEKIIIKTEKIINGIKFCSYKINRELISEPSCIPCNKVEQGYTTKLNGGIQQSCTNNIEDNNKNNNSLKENTKRKVDFGEFTEVMNTWLKYKAERRESYKSEMGIRTCFEKLKKLSKGNPAIAEEIIQTSIANNWAGIFALRNEKKNNETTSYEGHSAEWYEENMERLKNWENVKDWDNYL